MADQKKFLDYEGVKHLWSKINMQDYPNNETLMAVINAIDETKADKTNVVLIDEIQDLTEEQKIQVRKNIGAIDSSDLTILPIDKIADYGIDYEIYAGGSYTRQIGLTNNISRTDHYIFKVQIPEGYPTQTIYMYYKNPDGTKSGGKLLIVRNAMYLWISIDPYDKCIAVYEILSNREWRYLYDENGVLIDSTSTLNITTDNLITQLNSLSKTSSYIPSIDTDVATKEYVDKTISEQIATDDEIIDMLIEEDMMMAVIDSDGAILADENNNILLW